MSKNEKAARSKYTIISGKFHIGGEVKREGDVVELTASQAKAFSTAVTKVAAPVKEAVVKVAPKETAKVAPATQPVAPKVAAPVKEAAK